MSKISLSKKNSLASIACNHLTDHTKCEMPLHMVLAQLTEFGELPDFFADFRSRSAVHLSAYVFE